MRPTTGWKRFGRMLAMLSLFAVTLVASQTTDPQQQVQGLLDAFNAHDVDRMAAFLTDDVEWLSISGSEIAVEASGKPALREAMAGYFKSVPGARSEIEGSFVSGDYVVVRERAFWRHQGQERSQSALVVYQLVEGLIARVWYFPVEK